MLQANLQKKTKRNTMFHKNQKKQLHSEDIYNLFKPFCNKKRGKQGELSTCKNIYGMRCQYHDKQQNISIPYIDQNGCVKRDIVPKDDQHIFSKYDTDYVEDRLAFSINPKTSVCMVCVKGIREYLLSKGKMLFIRKMQDNILKEQNIDCQTYSRQFTQCISTDENTLEGLLSDVDKFLFDGNFTFENTQPVPINLFSYMEKTCKCDVCENNFTSCTCVGDYSFLCDFRYEANPQFEAAAKNYKNSQTINQNNKTSLKRKKFSQEDQKKVSTSVTAHNKVLSELRRDNDWKEDTLWYIAMETYCEFFSTIPATKPSAEAKKMDCDDVCKILLRMTNGIKDTNFIDVKNLLLTYLITYKEYTDTNHCSTGDENKVQFNNWLTKKYEAEDDNLLDFV